MNKLLKYCQIGGTGVIAEAGEFYKDVNGQIKQINPNTVSHDDYILIDEQGNPISKMPYNQGGVAVNGVQNVLSASHENRKSDDDSYKKADEDIRIKPKEGKEFAKRFNFGNIKFNGGSPSKLFNSVLEAKTNKLKKYNNIEYNENSPYGINSSKANGAYVEALPQDEMIYDEIFNYQESKKQESNEDTMQRGGNILYVESKDDSRYRAYQDSLNVNKLQKLAINQYNNSLKLTPRQRKEYWDSLGEEGADVSNPLYDSVWNLTRLNKKEPVLHENYGKLQGIGLYMERPKYFPYPKKPVQVKSKLSAKNYKQPLQKKILHKNQINNLNKLQSIPYQQQEVDYDYPKIDFTPIQEQEFYNPERVIGSEYNQNLDASYGKFQKRKSDYYDKQLQKINRQQGGKGTLSPYPEMYGSKPVAMVNIKGKLYPATIVDGRTVSMDDVFDKRDSVELKNFKAIKLNKNERPKK